MKARFEPPSGLKGLVHGPRLRMVFDEDEGEDEEASAEECDCYHEEEEKEEEEEEFEYTADGLFIDLTFPATKASIGVRVRRFKDRVPFSIPPFRARTGLSELAPGRPSHAHECLRPPVRRAWRVTAPIQRSRRK